MIRDPLLRQVRVCLMYHTPMVRGIAALGLMILAVTIAEQTPQKVFKVPVELVLAHAVVTDVNRHPVTGLDAADFLLKDNGVPQQISYFKPENEPFRVMIALDVSGSTHPKIELIKAAVKRFLRQLGPNDEIALMTFGDEIRMPSGFTSDREQLERAVDIVASGPSNKTILYDALSFAVRAAFKGIEGRKALVLLSDGFDVASGIDVDVLNRYLAETDCLIYSLVVDTEEDVREHMTGVLRRKPEFALVLDSSLEENEELVREAARYFVQRHGRSARIWLLARNCYHGPLILAGPSVRNERLLARIRLVNPSMDWPLKGTQVLAGNRIETFVITDTMEGMEARLGSCILPQCKVIPVGKGADPGEWQERISISLETRVADLRWAIEALPESYRLARHNMEVMATATGGRAYQLESVKRLDEFYELVARELRQVYTIGFYPSALTPGYHSLEVRTQTPGFFVRARTSYRR